jgi:hypothetical protein
VLGLAKSSYLEPFQKLADDIEQRTLEAQDNYRMLKPLQEPCMLLNKSALIDMPKILEDIMFLVRACWANSKYLNTVDTITGLLRKVSNALIVRCREVIDKTEIMEGSIPNSVQLLQQSIHCGDVWKKLVFTHIKLIANSAKQRAEKKEKAHVAAVAAHADQGTDENSKDSEGKGRGAVEAVQVTFDADTFLKEWDGERKSRIFAQV